MSDINKLYEEMINPTKIEKKPLNEGTSNFHNENASKVFAITDEDDEFIVEDTIDNIKSEMEADKKWTYYNGSNSQSELRSYPTRTVGGWYNYDAIDYTNEDDENEQVQIQVSIIALCRSGYYNGANFDWELELEVDGVNFDFNDFENQFFEYKYMNFDDEIKSDVVSKCLHICNEMIVDLEKIFSNYTDKLEVTARFSNGETIYNRVKESKNKSSIKEASSKNTREEIFTDYKQVDGKWEPIEYKFTFKKKTTGINKILLFALHGGGIHRMNTVGDGYYWFEGLEHGDWYSGGWYYKPMISKNIDGFVDMEDRSVWVKVGEPEIIGESDKKSKIKLEIKKILKKHGKKLEKLDNPYEYIAGYLPHGLTLEDLIDNSDDMSSVEYSRKIESIIDTIWSNI